MFLFFTFFLAFSSIAIEFDNLKKTFLHNNLPHKHQVDIFNRIYITTNTVGFNEVQNSETDEIVLGKEALNSLYILLNLITVYLIYLVAAIIFIIRKKNELVLDRKNNEVIKLNAILQNANNEKEILLKEIHHRVKNNLQVVMSLLNIQAQDKKDFNIDKFIEKGRSRIATIALIHENLSQTNNHTHVEFDTYLTNLVENINNTFSNKNVYFEINTNDNHFNLPTSIPLGLIINELLNNALKYAFPENINGKIKIDIIKKSRDTFELIIEDNGIGFSVIDKKSKSIGLELIKMLVQQLEGKLKKLNEKGTIYCIEFKEITNL